MRKAINALIVSTIVMGCGLYVGNRLFAQQPGSAKGDVDVGKRAGAKAQPDDEKRVPVDLARQRAKLAQTLLTSTLDVMHDQYFHSRGERTTVPARAMEEVFTKLASEENIKAKWIAVNATAMSITTNRKVTSRSEPFAQSRPARRNWSKSKTVHTVVPWAFL